MTTQLAGRHMNAEILEQPAMLARVALQAGPEVAAVARVIRRWQPRAVLLAARGSSDHAALYAKYLIEVQLGLPVGLVSASTMTLYGARPSLHGVLFLAVSQSGGSPDLIDSLSVARDCGALTVAITNNPASELARAAELSVDIRAGMERAVAATKSYTASLLALYLLVVELAEQPADLHQLAASLHAAATATLQDDAPAAAAARYRWADRLITTARGFSYPTAREAALKLMETCYLGAQAFSGADLLHGPMAMVDAAFPVLAVLTPGAGGRAMHPVLDALRQRGADLLVVGSAPQQATACLSVNTEGLPEALQPVVEILPLQRLACELALLRGSDPDAPRGLSKVTRTW